MLYLVVAPAEWARSPSLGELDARGLTRGAQPTKTATILRMRVNPRCSGRDYGKPEYQFHFCATILPNRHKERLGRSEDTLPIDTDVGMVVEQDARYPGVPLSLTFPHVCAAE